MKAQLVLVCATLLVSTPHAVRGAAPPNHIGAEPFGDWEVEAKFPNRENSLAAILSLSRDERGNQTGQWITNRRLSELEGVKIGDDGKLSFTWKRKSRDGQATSWKFNATIAEGKLNGTASGDADGHAVVKGKRIPPMPGIVGNWAMGYLGDRANSTLAIKVDKQGKLTADWQSDGGETTISEFSHEGGKLKFKFNNGPGDKGGSFEGSLRPHQNTIVGILKLDREFQLAALRIGTRIIGTWDLEVTSERGSWYQRLKVNPDMSAWLGTTPIDKVVLEGAESSRLIHGQRPFDTPNEVTFETTVKSGDRSFNLSFAGKVTDGNGDRTIPPKLSGEFTTPRGNAKAVGISH